MLGIYVLGRRWLTARAAVFAAIIWGTSLMVIDWGRQSRMDMMMASLTLYGIVLADLASTQDRGWRRTWIWCGASAVIGAAILSKGPVPIFFFLGTVVLLWRARHRRWFPPVGLLLIFLGIISAFVASWAISAEIAHPGHLKQLLGYQFGEGLKQHPKRLTLPVDQLLTRTMPWGFFAVASAYWAIGRFKRSGYGSYLIPVVMPIAGLVVMTVVPNKRPHYLLPLLPMWALFLGGGIDEALVPRGENGGKGRRGGGGIPGWAFYWPLRIALMMMLAAMGALLVYWVGHAHERKVAGEIVLAVTLVVAGLGTAAAWRKEVMRAVVMLFVLCSVLAVAAYPVMSRGMFEPEKDSVATWKVMEVIPRGVPVADYKVKSEYLLFKLNRPCVFLREPAELRSFLQGAGPRYLILPADDAEEVMSLTSRPVRRVATCEFKHFKVTVLEVGTAESAAVEEGFSRGIRVPLLWRSVRDEVSSVC
jgi:4-amino-4-deoxy-L-arabinose transferase-like glycosyltransferase